MLKYSISTLLLMSLIPFSLSALRELKGLRGTVCVKEVIQNPDGTLQGVRLAIDEGCDFKLKTNGTLEQESSVGIKRNDLTEIYRDLGIIAVTSLVAADEYILEFDVKGVCPFKQIPSICITPETNIESLAKDFEANPNPFETAALTSSLFAVTQVSKDTFRIRLYFTLAGFHGNPPSPTPHRVIGNFLKIFLEGSFATPKSPFCIHFIAADKPCKRRNH